MTISNPINRWIKKHTDQGPYAAFAGFDADLRKRIEGLVEAYEQMDIYAQIDLFAFVISLLEEADV